MTDIYSPVESPMSINNHIYEYADEFGNIWRYDESTDTYIKIGIISMPAMATEEQDGLLSPVSLNLLLKIEEMIKDGISFNANKLVLLRSPGDTENDPYFYFTYSTDDLIRFYQQEVDGKKKLRIELDRSRLLQRLTRTPCIGPQGLPGPKGDTGQDGIKAANERSFTPDFSPKSLGINVNVTTPLIEPISLRFYYKQELVLEFLISIDGTDTVTLITNVLGLKISETDIEYRGITLRGRILSDDIFPGTRSDWEYKARQRGPQGIPGEDGSSTLQIVPETIADPLLRVSGPINKLRFVQEKNLVFSKSDNLPEVAASSLQLKPDNISRNGVVLSVDYVSDPNKSIGFYDFADCGFDVSDLKLPSWTPQAACNDRRRFELGKFNWDEQIQAKDGNCHSQIIPFSILKNETPPDISCKDGFFTCPNLGDRCSFPIEGNIANPISENITETGTGSE
jgi:hypothetical protein